MKLREPPDIAFRSDDDFGMGHCEAEETRAKDFWHKLSNSYKYTEAKKSDDPHGFIKADILAFICRWTEALAAGMKGKCFDLPLSDIGNRWECIQFIVAFDTTYEYVPEEDECEEGDDGMRDDYLDDEGAFRHDVIKALDGLILEGAALARYIGSDTYHLWTDAMLKLEGVDGKEQYTAVNDAVNAIGNLWADLRTWIHMNRRQTAKKSTAKAKERKK